MTLIDPTYDAKNQQQPGDTWVIGGSLDIDSAGAGGKFKIDGVDLTAAIAALPPASNYAVGVAAGYKVARGQHTMGSAVDTVVTGLTTVTSVVASMESDPVLACDRVSAQIGDQAGSPAAGSAVLKAWMPTDATHTTPIAATGFAGIKVNWIAVGT